MSRPSYEDPVRTVDDARLALCEADTQLSFLDTIARPHLYDAARAVKSAHTTLLAVGVGEPREPRKVTALLDAAALAEDIANAGSFEQHLDLEEIKALRLLASHARASAADAEELDARRKIARANGVLATTDHRFDRAKRDAAFKDSTDALAALRRMGYDYITGVKR